MNDQPEINLGRTKVLVYHQSGVQNKHIQNVLRMCGLGDITRTDKIEDAVQSLFSQQFDLILVTHFGEAKDTSLFLEEIAAHQTTGNLPVMALTEQGSVKKSLRIMSKGVDEVLMEPLSPEQMEQKIIKILSLQSGRDRGRERINLARRLAAEGKLDEAESLFSDVAWDPRYAFEAQLGLVGIHLARGKLDEAQTALKEATDGARTEPDQVTLHTRMSRVLHSYGLLHAAQGQSKMAVKSFHTAMQMNPFNLENILSLLAQLQKDDDLEGIIGVMREAKANFLPYGQPLEAIAGGILETAERYKGLGLLDQATRLFSELSDLKHENAAIHLKVADFFLEKKDPARLVRPLMEVCARIKDADLLHRLGTILMDGDPKSLAEGVKITGKKDPLYDLSDPAKLLALARQAFTQAMMLEPDDPRHRVSLAALELRQGNTEAASQVLNRLKEVDLEDAQAYIRVINSLMDERAFGLAKEWLQEAQSAFPDHPEVARVGARYFLEMGSPFKAIAALKKGLAAKPNDAGLMLVLAETYLRERDYKEALFYFEKLAKLLPDNARVRRGLKRALTGK